MSEPPRDLHIFEWADRPEPSSGGGTDEILEGLFLTGEATGGDRIFQRHFQVRLVVCCNAKTSWPAHALHDGRTGETANLGTFEDFVAALRRAGPRDDPDDPHTYVYNIPADDSPMFDLSPWFARTTELLRLAMEEEAKLRCIVHCLAGVSRSATVIAAYLMQRTRLSAAEVLRRMRARRSVVNPNPGFVNQLQRWELMGYCVAAPGEARFAATRMAERLRQEPRDGAVAKLRSYLEAILRSAGSTLADRESVGALASELDAKGVLPFRGVADVFVNVSEDMLGNDEASDTPVLPARIVDVAAAINAEAATAGRPEGDAIGAAEVRRLVARTMVGLGDQFGFDPFATAVLLRRLARWRACPPDAAAAWVHLFAARVRSILEAGTPMAFPPGLGVDFADLDLNQLDDWTPALLPANTRRVLRSCLAGLRRTMREASEVGTETRDADDDDNANAAAAPADDGDDSRVFTVAEAVAEMVDARTAQGRDGVAAAATEKCNTWSAIERASVVVAFASIGDPLPEDVAKALGGGAASDAAGAPRFEDSGSDDSLHVVHAEARWVLDACDVPP